MIFLQIFFLWWKIFLYGTIWTLFLLWLLTEGTHRVYVETPRINIRLRTKLQTNTSSNDKSNVAKFNKREVWIAFDTNVFEWTLRLFKLYLFVYLSRREMGRTLELVHYLNEIFISNVLINFSITRSYNNKLDTIATLKNIDNSRSH